LAGARHAVALSVGTNPQFSGDAVTTEAYLLDFDGDLYERRVRLEVGERLRDERRFESIDALIEQIRQDVARVRLLLS
jgi:riboflavin kinase/FMN adenylyltransferase